MTGTRNVADLWITPCANTAVFALLVFHGLSCSRYAPALAAAWLLLAAAAALPVAHALHLGE